jgi:adenosylhomocysteine nucleosidase
MRARRIVPALAFLIGLIVLFSCSQSYSSPEKIDIVVLISADAEWKSSAEYFTGMKPGLTPFGEFFVSAVKSDLRTKSVIYFHGGWGKINAAASTQYAIDRWQPTLLINLGTCGGFEGNIDTGDVLVVTKTVVYDIIEQMGNSDEAVEYYSVVLDLSWLKKPYPAAVKESILVSADRDIMAGEIPRLRKKFGAVAADWESGAIAFTAKQNKIPCLILRAVSDLVGSGGGEVYGNIELFEKRTRRIMANLLAGLPAWVGAAENLFAR